MKKRNSRGQFKTDYSGGFQFLGMVLFTSCFGLGISIGSGNLESLLGVSQLAKAETKVEVVADKSDDATLGGLATIAIESATSTPAPLTEKQQILMYTIEVFGDKADEAIQIMKCESGYNPLIEGDKTLMSINNQTGELIGDSIGLFQIRTGDTNWNRARKEGMTVEEFRAEMRKPLENIKYAKKLYDAQGWKPWFNCMNKTGVGKN